MLYYSREMPENLENPPQTPEDSQAQVTPPQSKKPLSHNKKLAIGAAIILVVILVGGGSYYFASREPSEESLFPSPIETLSPENTESSSPSASGSPTSSPKSTKTPTPTPTPTLAPLQTKTIPATLSLDGFRSSNGGGNSGVDIRAGRNVNLVTRGFVSFDLSTLPAGAKIEKATLRLYQYNIAGNPYGVGGSLKVDHLDYGDSLGNEDYSASSLSSSFATLTSNTTLEWKDVDATDRLKNDRENNRSRSQYRLHFAIENIGGDATGDFTYFESQENTGGTGNLPQLVVNYR